MQHDLTIANQGFPAFRADLNDALQALGSCQSGTSAPSPTFANQLWYDTTNNILKIRNEDNDAWISIATLDQSGDLVALLVANTVNSVGDSTISGITVGKGGGAVATNTAVGLNAGSANTTGANNVFIGRNAAQSTTASFGTFVGSLAGNSTITGDSNTAVGYYSYGSGTSGTNNVAIGQQALYNNTTASNNTALGYRAGYSNTTGASNTFFGTDSAYTNTTGFSNVAIGKSAFVSNTTGSYNIAVGQEALYLNTTASNNTAVGYQANYSNATGGGVVAIGYQALKASTVDNNCAVGSSAALSTTTGSNNSAFGTASLLLNTTGASNTAVGYGALLNNTTASNNTAVGYQAGYANTTALYSTYVGMQAGYSTTGERSTFVGMQAGYSVTTGVGNTILGRYNGNQGGLDIRTSNYNIVLSDGDGNPRMNFDASGYACIGSGVSTSTAGGAFSVFTPSGNTAVYLKVQNTSTQYLMYFANLNGNTGGITCSGTSTTYATSSDYRLKEDIQPIVNATDKIAQLKPVTYKWKIDGSAGQGFIAHELAEIFPDAVIGEKDGLDKDGNIQPQGIDTSFLVATLTAAIQELKAEIDLLKSQLGK